MAFPILIDLTLKGLLVLVVASIAAACMRRASGASRHLVWLLAVVSLLLLPAVSALVPPLFVLPDWLVVTSGITSLRGGSATDLPHSAGLRPAPAGPSNARTGVETGNLAFGPLRATARAADPAGEELPGTLPPAGRAEPAGTAPGPHGFGDFSRLAIWLVMAWLTGFCIVLAIGAFGWLRLGQLERGSWVVAAGPLMDALTDLCRRLGIRRTVRLLASDTCAMPMTWGSLRPRLLLPDEAATWPADRCRVVLLHELAHVARWDFAAQLLTWAAVAVHWFNPLVWWAARRMASERERACDDIVLGAGFRPSAYAHAVLEIAAGLSRQRCPGQAAIAMARRSTLDGRIRAILNPAGNRRTLTRSAVAAATALACGACLLLGALRMAGARAESPGGESEPVVQPDAGSEQKRAASRMSERVLRFPAEAIGVVYTRGWQADGYDVGNQYDDWVRLGEARGEIRVASGADVRLDVGSAAAADLSPLAGLAADDLQSLWLRGTQVDDEGLRHVGRLTGLVYLDLDSTRITDDGIEHLAGLDQLQAVKVSAFSVHRDGFGVGDKAVAILAKLPALAQIDLRLTKVTDAGLVELGKMKRLKSLGLAGTKVTDAGLPALTEATSLEYLTLGVYSEGTAVTDAGLKHLAGLTNLKWLNLSDTKITDAGLIHLGDLPHLEHLGLDNTAITDAGLVHVRHLESLKTLTLPRGITDAGAEHLSRITSLEQLPSNFEELTDAGLAHLAGLDHLWRLSLMDEGITDEGMRRIGRMPALKLLWLQDCAVTDEGLSSLSGLKELENLLLGSMPLTGGCLRHFSELPQLASLAIRVEGDFDLERLAELKALKSLDIEARLANEALANVGRLEQLEELELSGFVVNDEGISHLARLKGLKRLAIDEALITDAGLAQVAGLPALESLTISAPVTDAGVAHLARLRSLNMLQIASPYVTDEALASLRQKLPSLQWVYRRQYRLAQSDASSSDHDGFWRQGAKEDRGPQDALEGKRAPPLEVDGWLNTDERPLTLADLKGKVVLLDFWGVWCGPCIAFMPELQEVYQRHKDQGLVLISIHTTQDAEKMAAFVEEQGYGWPMAADVDEKTVKAFAVNSYPGFYLIDRAGTLRIADVHRTDLDKAVTALLAEPAEQ